MLVSRHETHCLCHCERKRSNLGPTRGSATKPSARAGDGRAFQNQDAERASARPGALSTSDERPSLTLRRCGAFACGNAGGSYLRKTLASRWERMPEIASLSLAM